MSENNQSADKNIEIASFGQSNIVNVKISATESVRGMTSLEDAVVQNEHEDRLPTEEKKEPEPRDEMLEAALAVVAASTSSFARLGPSAPSQQPISASPLRGITIHLVRHAERPHNLRSIPEKERIDMLDPGLTEYGLAQCVLLSERFHAMDKVTKILASPLCRTLHTALVAFKPAIERGIQVVLYPDLRECGGGRCNTGTNIEDLLKDLFEIEEDIQKDCVDASLCEPGWETGTESLEKKDMRIQRAERVLSMLYHLGKMSANASDYDVEIVVVTHSRLILLLEGHTSESKAYHNAEYKSYRLISDEEVPAGVNKFKLIETEESKNYIHTFPEDTDEE